MEKGKLYPGELARPRARGKKYSNLALSPPHQNGVDYCLCQIFEQLESDWNRSTVERPQPGARLGTVVNLAVDQKGSFWVDDLARAQSGAVPLRQAFIASRSFRNISCFHYIINDAIGT
jgi:hypothetical protein